MTQVLKDLKLVIRRSDSGRLLNLEAAAKEKVKSGSWSADEVLLVGTEVVRLVGTWHKLEEFWSIEVEEFEGAVEQIVLEAAGGCELVGSK